MGENSNNIALNKKKKGFSGLQVFGLLILAVIITAGATILVFKTYIFPSEFKPVNLNSKEKGALSEKLETLDSITGADVSSYFNDGTNRKSPRSENSRNDKIQPEPYSEKNAVREIMFTERELNGLLANNTDLAKKMVIDLSDDLISAKLILPVDENFPVMGGKILRLKSGLHFSYDKGKPVVILKGVTIMGVPIPDAWLGGIKDIDLVEKFGNDNGFWKTFSDGVEYIKIEEGHLKVKLKE